MVILLCNFLHLIIQGIFMSVPIDVPFLFLIVVEYFIVWTYHNFFNQCPISVHWIFLHFFFMLQTLLTFLCVWRMKSQKWNTRTREHAHFTCEEELLNGIPPGFCLFLPPSLPFSSLVWDFSLFLIFYKGYTFLSYMCGTHTPQRIFYLLILFTAFFIVQKCLLFREPTCLVLCGFQFPWVSEMLSDYANVTHDFFGYFCGLRFLHLNL